MSLLVHDRINVTLFGCALLAFVLKYLHVPHVHNLNWKVVTVVFTIAYFLGTLVLHVRSRATVRRLQRAQWLLCPKCESAMEGQAGAWRCAKCGLCESVEHPKNLWIAKFASAHCAHAVLLASMP